MRPVLAGFLLLSWGCSRAPESPASAPPADSRGPAAYRVLPTVPGAGRVSGVVRLAGPVPKMREHPVTQDPAACGRGAHASRALLVGKESGVANCVVRLEEVAAGAAFPPAPVLLDQRSCEFEPRVQVASLGSTITLANGDAASHNVHAYDETNATLWNATTPSAGTKAEETLARGGLIRLKCDVHPWMIGWLWVTDRPYAAVTDKDGRFAIGNVPPGKYRLSVWHELLGGAGGEVSVPAGGDAHAELTVSVAGG